MQSTHNHKKKVRAVDNSRAVRIGRNFPSSLCLFNWGHVKPAMGYEAVALVQGYHAV